MTGGFSRAIDLVQSQYHTPLAEILDTPLCRFRQQVECITQRIMEDHRFHAKVVEWQTKNLAIMFTSNADSPKQAREIAKAVKKMVLPMADEADQLVDNRSIEEVIEQGAMVTLQDQPTVEALESMFSGGK